jgi:hypothetical protein
MISNTGVRLGNKKSEKKKIAAETLLDGKLQVNVNGTGNKTSYSIW